MDAAAQAREAEKREMELRSIFAVSISFCCCVGCCWFWLLGVVGGVVLLVVDCKVVSL